MRSLSKKFLWRFPPLFLALLVLSLNFPAVHALGLKVQSSDYGLWSSQQTLPSASNATEGWLEVTITNVEGYDLTLTVVDDEGTNSSFVQTNVNFWYPINETYFFITTNWDEHRVGWTDYFNGLGASSIDVQKIYFYFYRFLPRVAYKFQATLSTPGGVITVEYVYDQSSGTLLEMVRETLAGSERTVEELDLQDSNVPQGFSFLAFGVFFAALALFVFLLSLGAQRLRTRHKRKLKDQEAEETQPAYYVPPSSPFSSDDSSPNHSSTDSPGDNSSSQEALSYPLESSSRPSKRRDSPPKDGQICPFCGAKVEVGQEFCLKCGATL